MNEHNLKRIIERNTLLLMYEPGAGGDFLTALLSVDPLLHGSDSRIKHHQNGRIKAMATKLSVNVDKTINDYEYQNNISYYESLREQLITLVLEDLCTSNSKFISKLHPYIDKIENVEKLILHIKNNYDNSKKIILLRDYDICLKNHFLKNGNQQDYDYHSHDWYNNFEKIYQVYPDILIIKFADILKNPIYTLTKIYKHMGYDDSQITYNFKINKDKIKSTYCEYVENQQHLEDVKRYWT